MNSQVEEHKAADDLRSVLCFGRPLNSHNWTSTENYNHIIMRNSEIATIFQASLSSRYYATKNRPTSSNLLWGKGTDVYELLPARSYYVSSNTHVRVAVAVFLIVRIKNLPHGGM